MAFVCEMRGQTGWRVWVSGKEVNVCRQSHLTPSTIHFLWGSNLAAGRCKQQHSGHNSFQCRGHALMHCSTEEHAHKPDRNTDSMQMRKWVQAQAWDGKIFYILYTLTHLELLHLLHSAFS